MALGRRLSSPFPARAPRRVHLLPSVGSDTGTQGPHGRTEAVRARCPCLALCAGTVLGGVGSSCPHLGQGWLVLGFCERFLSEGHYLWLEESPSHECSLALF